MGGSSSSRPEQAAGSSFSKEYEIEYDAIVKEWHPVDGWIQDTNTSHSIKGSSHEKNRNNEHDDVLKCNYLPFCYSCCRNAEEPLEEVVIVHHAALRKVDFMLKYDELARCESPGIPACVTAVKHRKLHQQFHGGKNFDGDENAFSGIDRITASSPLGCAESAKSGDDEESTCSEDGGRPLLSMEPSQVINHIVQERKKLQNFLQRMAVDGLACKTLEKIANGGKQRRRARGILRNCMLGIEEREELHLILDLEQMTPRVIPFPTISGIIFGSFEDSIEGEDPKLCFLLVQRVPSSATKSTEVDVYHYVKFFNETDRDFFKEGIRRLRTHNHIVQTEQAAKADEHTSGVATPTGVDSNDEMAK